MLFSVLKRYLELFITDTALKVSRSLYCFTTSISHSVENFFPRLWGTGISDAIFLFYQEEGAVSWEFIHLLYGRLLDFGIYAKLRYIFVLDRTK